MKDFFERLNQIQKRNAEWVVDAIAAATQDRRFLVGDAQEDKNLTEVVLLNAEQAIRRAVTECSGLEALRGSHELFDVCSKFVKEHDISCAEAVYDSDQIIADAYELIEGICNIVGYVKTDEDQ